MNNASLELGGTNWAEKDASLLGYTVSDDSGRFFPQEFTFSRGSNLAATRIGKTGLIEKGRENLLLQSNQFDTTWTVAGSTITDGQSGYDGSNNAWLLSKSSASGNLGQNTTSNGVTTFSVYAKANASPYLRLIIFDGTFATNGAAYFDLQNGALGTTNAIDSNIESVGNGWYRCSVSFNTSNQRVYIYPAEANSTTGASGSIYIQDAQLEIGLAATDYIESGATTGKAGLLEDEPRFDYSGGATCPSLLLEPSRTNLIRYSEYFDGSYWTKDRVTISNNATTSPEGKLNASKIIEDSQNGVHRIFRTISGTNNVLSFFAKADERQWISVFSSDASYSYFNVGDGTLGTIASGSTATIEDYGNGWYRCSLHNFYSTTAIINIATGNGVGGYQGDGTSGLYIYGIQVEEASYPTSYIPNHSGGSVTRGEDALTSLNITSLVTGTPFTWFLDLNEWQGSDTNVGNLYLSNSPSRIELRVRNDGYRILYNAINAGTLYPISASKTARKFCIKYDGSNFKLFLDGVLENTTASAGDTGWSGLSQAAGGSTLPLDQILVFNEALSDADCIAITSL